jgi:hypothetical protein
VPTGCNPDLTAEAEVADAAFVEMKPDEKAVSVLACLKAAAAYYNSRGVTASRAVIDNGSCSKAFDFRDACRDLGLKHIRTKPDTPKTTGKAERFIQTAQREWAYARPCTHLDRRTEECQMAAGI